MLNNQKDVKRILRWALAVVTIIIIISGLGINYYTTIEYLTFGLLSKNLAFQLHFWIFIPFLVLFLLHIFIRPILKLLGESSVFLVLKNNIALILATIIILGVSTYLIAGLLAPSEPIRLDNVEVKEYKCQKLSSVTDFRENSIKGPQYINITNYRLEVTGLVNNPKNYTYDDVIKNHQNYEKVVKLECVEGWDVTILWQGVLVKDIINEVKPKSNANTVIFYANDGYSSSFTFDYLQNNNILMAYKMNNATIPPERGFPFQLVAESKWGYKWVKWITKIELSDNPNYQGYWEIRGYSDSGNLNESFLRTF
ncbi:molybdopterin-dependent oxidoreductase [Methanobacterium sp. ACI-7]|uniref:molybdopterin-dependent oxidoreductase n=1 Tax=unclassified Methanobacterium TaxID=2627676 RepID=UPI0039C21FFA